MSGVSTLKAGPSIPSQSQLGRFISRDPIGFAGGFNLFNGPGTSPVMFVDPEGLKDFSVGGNTISVMLNDADPLPSNPHGHIETGPYAGHKVDLATGEIKSTARGKAGEVIGSLGKRELTQFQNQLDKAYGSGMMVKVPVKGSCDYVKPFTKGARFLSIMGVPFKILDVVGTMQEVKSFCEVVREGPQGPLRIPTIYIENPKPNDMGGFYMIGPSIINIVPVRPGMRS